ncbi:Transitional endoplasmic reticulum ATPase [Strongyloides ratti]|uniref:Peroxisomal ATPase PEX1 n=1 Tax=Strongyloides ratti TaxID=34506 RepID=A0A090KZU1_STRRB|nr:Transitional endoplasmic reticulum ATPase [Strongyloides ratti]CEF62951.1 Transitional endoplasmic reticulum ATPase [Strongyloides ratti]
MNKSIKNGIKITVSKNVDYHDVRTIYLPIHFMIKEMIHPNTLYNITFLDKTNNIKLLSTIILVKILNYNTWIRNNHAIMNVTSAFNVFGTLILNKYTIKKLYISKEIFSCTKVCKINMIRIYKKSLDIPIEKTIENFLEKETFVKDQDILCIKKVDLYNFETTGEKIFFKVNLDTKYSYLNLSTTMYQLYNINNKIPGGYSYDSKYNILIKSLKKIVKKICKIYESNLRIVPSSSLILALVGVENCGQREIIRRVSDLLCYQLIELDIYDLWNYDSDCFDVKLFDNFTKVHEYTPCIVTIKNCGLLGNKNEKNEHDLFIIQKLVEFLKSQNNSIIIIFTLTFTEFNILPTSIKGYFTYEIIIPTITEEMRYEFFKNYCSNKMATYLSKKTLGYSYNELYQLIDDSIFFRNFDRNTFPERNFLFKPQIEDFDKALEKRTKSLSHFFNGPTIPNVRWKDIGGLEETKLILQESLGINRKNNINVRRSGVVLYGPPGCGKTLIAKAVANEFNISFISVKGPELLNQYIGQSEENIRKLFEKAYHASPCIVFFDEMDSLCPSQGRSSDSGGVIDRVVSQLLTELDTVNNTQDCKVFVMAATNRPDLLNQALLSPGRFDKTIHIKAAEDIETKVKVLEAVTRKLKLSDDVELKKVAQKCPRLMSGADIYSLMSNAVMEAVRENIYLLENDKINNKNLFDEKKLDLIVSMKHITKSLEMFKNSLAPSDHTHKNGLQNTI